MTIAAVVSLILLAVTVVGIAYGHHLAHRSITRTGAYQEGYRAGRADGYARGWRRATTAHNTRAQVEEIADREDAFYLATGHRDHELPGGVL